MNEYKISGIIFYIILLINFMASILLNASSIFLINIIAPENSNGTQTNISKENTIYYAKIQKIELDGIYFRFTVIFSIILLILNLIFVFKFGLEIKNYIKIKHIEKKRSNSFQTRKICPKRKSESIALYKNLKNLTSIDFQNVLGEVESKHLSIETGLLCFLMLILFVLDQFIKYFCVVFFIKIDRNSQEYLIFWIIYVSLVFIIQFSQVLSVYKFNTTFSKRLKYLCFLNESSLECSIFATSHIKKV
jgi:hypothetical protein